MGEAAGPWLRRRASPLCPGIEPSRLPAAPMAKPTAISRLLLPLSISCTNTSSGPRAYSSTTPFGRLDSWTLSLERGIGKAYGTEAELQATGAFCAEVFPDLPIATTWQNLAKALSSGLATAGAANPSPPFTHYTTRPGALKIITTAANLRSEYDIECRLVAAASDGAEASGGQRANGLLCVSGSHPVRSLPLVSKFLRSSLDTLRLAERLRRRGYIPPKTQLWVVANPNTERSTALLEAKVSLGASAVLTQPPLDWAAYLSWLADAERRGLLRPLQPPPSLPPTSANDSHPSPPTPSSQATPSPAHAMPGRPDRTSWESPTGSSNGNDKGDAGAVGGLRLLVGHPILSSAANLSFWMSLSGCSGVPAVQSLLAEAAHMELQGAEAAARYFATYNRRLVQQVLDRGCVAGLHVMPIPRASKKMLMDMLADGSLPPSSSMPH